MNTLEVGKVCDSVASDVRRETLVESREPTEYGQYRAAVELRDPCRG